MHVGRLAHAVLTGACVTDAEADRGGWTSEDEGGWEDAPWTDENRAAARMAGSWKRRKKDGPRKPRSIPALLPAWKDHVARTCVIPIGMMKGLSKREVYT